MIRVEFFNQMKELLENFHEFQLNYTDPATSRPPYEYNTLGLVEWMEYDFDQKEDTTKKLIN